MDYRNASRTGNKRNRIVDGTVFAILLTAVSVVTLVLFYRQTMGNPQRYHSDMKAYILEMQGLESGYSFPYPVFFKLAALVHLFAPPELSVAIATMLLNSLAILVTKLAFNRLVLRDLEEAFHDDVNWLAGAAVSLGAVSLFFISMLYPPEGIYLPGIKYKYLGVFTPNPFHNATYMAARPFAILALLWFVKLLPVYEKENVRSVDYILFSLFLLAATMTKPGFTLAMVSTAGLLMLYRLFRSGFRNFIPTVRLGLCFIPTFADLLYQFRGVFVPADGAEGGIGFCFGEIWADYCGNIPLAVCLGVGFPLLVLVLNRRECRKGSLFGFSWLLFLVSFGEAFFLYEKGFRKPDFNFSWGYMCGIFFCHFAALAVLLQATARKLSDSRTGKGKRGYGSFLILIQWLAYLWHLVCGLLYFKTIFGGGMYY